MKRKRRWFRTDEFADTEGSLRKAAQIIPLVHSDISEWKWALIAVHSATQGMFVLALARGNNLLTLKSSHASAWLQAYRSGGPMPARLDLDYFCELFKKVKRHLPASSGSLFTATAAHDQSVRKLNDLRNGFIHLGAQGWSIQLAGLPGICLRCLEIVEHVGWTSGVVFWRSAAQGQRARRALRTLTRHVRRLEREYK